MNKLFGSFLCVAVIGMAASCAKTENPEVVRQIRLTVSEAVRTYSDEYDDIDWISENFYTLFFPDLNSYDEIENIIKSKGLKFETAEGLKIYKEVERKDLRYLKEDDAYLVRNDFTVGAIFQEDSLNILKEPIVCTQYYKLKKDPGSDNRYKIIEVYPRMDKNDLIYKEAFVEHYTDFTQSEEIRQKVERMQ